MESCKIQIHNKNNFGLSPQEIQLVFLNMISLSSVFWDATPCSLVNIYRLFGGTCCSIFRKTKAVHSCKKSIFLYRTTRRHTLSWGSQHTIPFARRVSKLLTCQQIFNKSILSKSKPTSREEHCRGSHRSASFNCQDSITKQDAVPGIDSQWIVQNRTNLLSDVQFHQGERQSTKSTNRPVKHCFLQCSPLSEKVRTPGLDESSDQ
jgi:hypothetical protein